MEKYAKTVRTHTIARAINPIVEFFYIAAVASKRGAKWTHATFGNDACFLRATFGNETTFTGATFGQRADFTRAAFGDRARFTGATFGPISSMWTSVGKPAS
jgi:Pentapeptide repeats (9 copies)